MNRVLRLLLIATISCFCLGLGAQTSTGQVGQGTVRGTVLDGQTGETIIFGNVLVQETSSGTTTDFDGKYNLDLPVGTYTLVFSYVGYSDYTVSDVVVSEGDVFVLDVQISEETETLDEVVVTAKAIRNTDAAIMTIQKKSPNLIDGMTSQSFRRIGDGDAGAAIKRVTGVSVEGGKYVFVRGLGDRYTKSMLNGMDIPGLDPDRNTVQMDLFPTNLIDNLIVVKSFTPDMPGDFTGGVIDIVTKDFPETNVTSISAGIGYNPSMHFNSNYVTYNGSATDMLGFDNGDRELPINKNTDIPLTSSSNNNQLPGITQSFNPQMDAFREQSGMNYNLAFSTGDQINKANVTFGYNAALNYRSTTEFYDDVVYGIWIKAPDQSVNELQKDREQKGSLGSQDVLLSGLLGGAMKWGNNKISLTGLHIQNGTKRAGEFTQQQFIRNSNMLQRDNLEYTERSITNALLHGTHSLNDGKTEVEWKLSPTISRSHDKDVRLVLYRIDDGDFSIEPSEGAQPRRIWRSLDEINYTSRVDVTQKFQFRGRDSKIKIGGSYAYKDRDYEILEYRINARQQRLLNNGTGFTGDPSELLQTANIWTPESRVGTYIEGNLEPANTYNSTQATLGVYIMNELPISDRLKAIYGLRLENFVHNYTGQDNFGLTVLEDEEVLNEWNFLPALNLVYALTEDMNLRASYSRTLARASFKENSIAQIYDAISDLTFIGGVSISDGQISGVVEQTDVDNFDIRWELFGTKAQKFSVSGFYKKFTNPIEIVAFSEVAPDNFTPRNVGDARVLGVEFEAIKNLDFINPNLEKFKLGTNVTLVHSEVEMDKSEGGEYESRVRVAREGEMIDDTRDMQGQSPFIINAFLAYEGLENGWEANLSYNVQGERLSLVGVALSPDVYEKSFNSLNFKISKRLGSDKRFRVSFGVTNMLDDDRERVYQSHSAQEQIFSIFSPRRTFSTGVSYRIR